MFVALFFIFLYVPIAVLVVFSLSSSSVAYEWGGFSLRWYVQLFASRQAWLALRDSLIVALSSVFLSITMAAFLVCYSPDRFRRFFALFYGALLVPEVIVAVGLLGFFSLLHVPLGYTTLIAGHTLLGLGYAVPTINARYAELEKHLSEASLDLGATHLQTFGKIILPLLTPSLVASSLLIFVVSLDDFLIAFFCAGAQVQTLPLYIFSAVRAGGSPMVNALSVVLLGFGSFIIVLMAFMQTRKGFSFTG